MNKPDAVLRELGQLYDFHKELAKFRFRERPAAPEPSGAKTPWTATEGRTAPPPPPKRTV